MHGYILVLGGLTTSFQNLRMFLSMFVFVDNKRLAMEPWLSSDGSAFLMIVLYVYTTIASVLVNDS